MTQRSGMIVAVAAFVGGVLVMTAIYAQRPQSKPQTWQIHVNGAKPFNIDGEWKDSGSCKRFVGKSEILLCAPFIALEVLPGTQPPPAPAPTPTPAVTK